MYHMSNDVGADDSTCCNNAKQWAHFHRNIEKQLKEIDVSINVVSTGYLEYDAAGLQEARVPGRRPRHMALHVHNELVLGLVCNARD